MSNSESLFGAKVFVHRLNNPNQHPVLICSVSSHFHFSACQLHTPCCKHFFGNRNSHSSLFSEWIDSSLPAILSFCEALTSTLKRLHNLFFVFFLFIRARKKKSQETNHRPCLSILSHIKRVCRGDCTQAHQSISIIKINEIAGTK